MSIFLSIPLIQEGWVLSIAIGLSAGWLAAMLTRRRNAGLFALLLVGMLGSIVGPFLFDKLGIHIAGTFGRLVSATAGAIALLILLRLLHRAA